MQTLVHLFEDDVLRDAQAVQFTVKDVHQTPMELPSSGNYYFGQPRSEPSADCQLLSLVHSRAMCCRSLYDSSQTHGLVLGVLSQSSERSVRRSCCN